MTVLFDLKVYGAYNIPKTGGVLIVSNHQSYLDPILLSTCLDRTLSYLAKAELFKNRISAGSFATSTRSPSSRGRATSPPSRNRSPGCRRAMS